MSYETIVEGLHERLVTVTALKAVLDYVPTSVQDSPVVWSVLADMKITRTGQVVAKPYRILHRVAIQWQDNEQAELAALPLVDSIPDAVEADPHLGGRLVSGMAEINECEAGWATIGGLEFRLLDFYSTVVEK
jgi:hypothetical protein